MELHKNHVNINVKDCLPKWQSLKTHKKGRFHQTAKDHHHHYPSLLS